MHNKASTFRIYSPNVLTVRLEKFCFWNILVRASTQNKQDSISHMVKKPDINQKYTTFTSVVPILAVCMKCQQETSWIPSELYIIQLQLLLLLQRSILLYVTWNI